MSAPIRKQVKVDEVPTAEAVRAKHQTPADSDLTRETRRVMFPDQLSSKQLEENPVTGQKNEHVSAKPLVVRRLKDPPEIWDLVHETPPQFNPGGAFVARLTSRKTNLVLAVLGVMFISVLAAFAFMTLRDGRKDGGAAAQVKEESGTSQSGPASQSSAPASAPESALNAPVNTAVDTSPGAESVVDNTAPQPTASLPTVPSDNAAFAGQTLTDSIQPTGGSEAQANGSVVNSISKRTASHAGRTAAWSRNKRVTVASGWENADRPGDKPADNRAYRQGPARGASRAPRPDTGAKPQTSQASQPLDLKRRHEKNSSDSASANKGSSPALSPQLIAPPTTTSAPKAKVIQWP